MREEYLKMRNSNNFNTKWLYDYFIKAGGDDVGINIFFQCVNLYGFEKICKGLDKVFNITTLSYIQTEQPIKYY